MPAIIEYAPLRRLPLRFHAFTLIIDAPFSISRRFQISLFRRLFFMPLRRQRRHYAATLFSLHFHIMLRRHFAFAAQLPTLSWLLSFFRCHYFGRRQPAIDTPRFHFLVFFDADFHAIGYFAIRHC
jgi:hypothetical protein